MPLTWEATSKVTNEFLNTVFNDRPRYEILDGGIKGDMIGGCDTFLLLGGMGLGKTSDIIKVTEMIGNYQTANDSGVRQMHIGVMRNSNANFINTVGKSFSYWYNEQPNKNFKEGYLITDARTQPKVIVRYPCMQIQLNEETGDYESYHDGTTCELIYYCYAVDKAGDEEKFKGGEFTITWSNEGNTTSRESYEMMSSRGDRFPPQGADYPITMIDLNPTHVKSWDYKYFIENPKPNVKVLIYPPPIIPVPDPKSDKTYLGKRVRWTPNPEATIHRRDKQGNPDYSYWFKMTTKSDDFITNNIMGEYLKSIKGRSAYTGFDMDIHVSKKKLRPEAHATLTMPTDFGVMACILICSQNDEGVFYIHECLLSETGFIDLFADFTEIMLGKYHIWHPSRNGLFVADPRTGSKRDAMSGTTSRKKIEAAGWSYTVPIDPDSGKIIDNRVQRKESLDQMLKDRKILIDPDCIDVIDALAFGAIANDENLMDKKKSGKYSEIIDCLEYLASWNALGGKATEEYSNQKITHAY